VVQALLDKGAEVNMIDSGGIRASPLHWAAWGGHDRVADLLLCNSAAVNCRDGDGETPLHYAAERGMRGVIEVLRVWGADESALSAMGESPLVLACQKMNQFRDRRESSNTTSNPPSSSTEPTSVLLSPNRGRRMGAGKSLFSPASPPPSVATTTTPPFLMPINAKGKFDFGEKIKGSLEQWRVINPDALVANVSGRKELTEKDLSTLAGVRALDLSGCDLSGVSDEAFAPFKGKHLHTLDVFRCKGFRDAHLASIAEELHSLQLSGLDQPRVTRAGILALKAVPAHAKSILFQNLYRAVNSSEAPLATSSGAGATQSGS